MPVSLAESGHRALGKESDTVTVLPEGIVESQIIAYRLRPSLSDVDLFQSFSSDSHRAAPWEIVAVVEEQVRS